MQPLCSIIQPLCSIIQRLCSIIQPLCSIYLWGGDWWALDPGPYMPGICARHICWAYMPGISARHMLGTNARHMCQAFLPGTYARHLCQAYLPGKCARHICPAYVPGIYAGYMPGLRAWHVKLGGSEIGRKKEKKRKFSGWSSLYIQKRSQTRHVYFAQPPASHRPYSEQLSKTGKKTNKQTTPGDSTLYVS